MQYKANLPKAGLDQHGFSSWPSSFQGPPFLAREKRPSFEILAFSKASLPSPGNFSYNKAKEKKMN